MADIVILDSMKMSQRGYITLANYVPVELYL